MKFTTKRSVADQILESILEEPEKWTTSRTSEGNAVSQVHRSGLEIWSYLSPKNTQIYRPVMEDVKFTQEEKTRIYNAIERLKKERNSQGDLKRKKQVEKERKSDEKRIISMLNEIPRKLLLAFLSALIIILIVMAILC